MVAGILLGIYLIWAALFIYQSSYIAIDGHRYFGLFDDAMISMRYAWNFAHGNGLVWNVGQRVEGYTNLLMTLVMSVAALLLNKDVDRVPVVKEDRLVGFLTRGDIVRKLIGT